MQTGFILIMEWTLKIFAKVSKVILVNIFTTKFDVNVMEQEITLKNLFISILYLNKRLNIKGSVALYLDSHNISFLISILLFFLLAISRTSFLQTSSHIIQDRAICRLATFHRIGDLLTIQSFHGLTFCH